MTLSHWLPIAALCLLGAITPGPSLAVVVRQTVKHSRRHGMAAALCHGAGVGLWALLTIWGLALLLSQSPQLFQWLTWGGAGYLAWLGIKALRSGGGGALQVADCAPAPVWQAGLEGLMISLLNPKLALFFIALFSQFVGQADSLQAQLLMTATAAGIDAGWYLLVAVLLSHSAVLSRLQRQSIWLDRITGGIMLALAVRVVTL
ncbi:LysE family translocator [Marinobacterium arenosum]|uniref:LysE family translocator n=1 Tax=Marinobacterium arenosum TaxID=2862496 RepID=UPI001C938D9D|nr:LysE family translocator [Marinobacterium arenosum]MBY4678094.1 LysE family translocator [Marinobacterium arenosum]